jgi:glycosyltransferase involved in cell wall biosynthesis
MSARRLKVAFVVQRCGREVNGGAEQLCLQVAQHLSKYWDSEVLTTCARDYMEWANFYPEGKEQIGPTVVRRFLVDQPRDVDAFNRLSADLHSRQNDTSLAEQEAWMRAQGPLSTGLFDYLGSAGNAYDAVIFFGYLYATTYFGLPLVRDKAWLAPLAHDEWTIYFSMWDQFFRLPVGLFFQTEAEQDFLERRFRDNLPPGRVTGAGVDGVAGVAGKPLPSTYNLSQPFLLYVGRLDESKGCAVMFDYFRRWKEQSGAPHKLVLIGQEVMPLPFFDDIIYLGVVSEAEKLSAMASCDWLIMPSPHESLSLVLLETWQMGRPTLVNEKCDVLVRHCRQSNGGLWYHGFDDWCAILSTTSETEKNILGQQGRRYVAANYSWTEVESRYLAAIKTPPEQTGVSGR